MTENGFAVQVVEVTAEHSYRLDEAALRSVLYQDEIRGLPVMVLSVAGAARSGKSFLLNWFLRYLTSPDSARQDDSWLGTEQEPLTGFSWRGGTERNTTGILLWSEPLKITLPNGSKVAVLLMDTQGTFDNKSTVRDCSTIFALSTLLSSVQIYNLTERILEDDLQHLELFTHFGKLAGGAKGPKPFQVLEFLVRDWGNDFQYSYGPVGGQSYLESIMKVTPDMPSDLRELRKHLRSSFETLSCFLMPHPGLVATKKIFEGKLADIGPDFIEFILKLTSQTFSPQKVKVKTTNGRATTCSELFTYFKTYVEYFNSKDIPSPKNIVEATIEADMLLAVKRANGQYEKAMGRKLGENLPPVSRTELNQLHQQEWSKARTDFQNTKTMASAKQKSIYLSNLTADLNARFEQFKTSNQDKVVKIISDAKEAYDKKLSEISGTKPLCVLGAAVEEVHGEAMAAAVKVLDATRKMMAGNYIEIDSFIKEFGKNRLNVLKNINEMNNKEAVSNALDGYWEYMQSVYNREPAVSSGQLESEHLAALNRAVEQLARCRTRPANGPDVYNTTLTNHIQNMHRSMTSVQNSQLAKVRKEREDLARALREDTARLKAERDALEQQSKQYVKTWCVLCAIL